MKYLLLSLMLCIFVPSYGQQEVESDNPNRVQLTFDIKINGLHVITSGTSLSSDSSYVFSLEYPIVYNVTDSTITVMEVGIGHRTYPILAMDHDFTDDGRLLRTYELWSPQNETSFFIIFVLTGIDPLQCAIIHGEYLLTGYKLYKNGIKKG